MYIYCSPLNRLLMSFAFKCKVLYYKVEMDLRKSSKEVDLRKSSKEVDFRNLQRYPILDRGGQFA